MDDESTGVVASSGNLWHVNAYTVPACQQSRSKSADQGQVPQCKEHVSSTMSKSASAKVHSE